MEQMTGPHLTSQTTAAARPRGLSPAVRLLLALLLAAGLLGLLQGRADACWGPGGAPPVASGGWSGPRCGDFGLTQGYRNWGPADSYGHPVTVSYQATRCSRLRGRTMDVNIDGVAVVYRGAKSAGKVVDEQSFSVVGSWTNPTNREGWPPDWWDCGVRSAEYSWRIGNVYTFSVTAEQGVWHLDVQAGNDPVSWTYDACA
jgi:hypothetical protein